MVQFDVGPFTTIEDTIGHLSLCCFTPQQSQSKLVIGEAVTRGGAPDPINIHRECIIYATGKSYCVMLRFEMDGRSECDSFNQIFIGAGVILGSYVSNDISDKSSSMLGLASRFC